MTTENTDNTTSARRPLGYWLRAVDRLIAREFAQAFADEGVSRRDWRILTVLTGDVDAPELLERLQGKKLRRLVDRGWITETEGAWTVTDEGRAAKERLGDIVAGIRARVSGSVSDDDFVTTVASLEAIARELGWTEETATRGFGRGFGRGRRGRGFGPGFRTGFSPDEGFGPDDRFAGRPPFGPRGFGRGDCGDDVRPHHRGYGHSGHGHPGHGHRAAQRAYERGFDAGFTRGRDIA